GVLVAAVSSPGWTRPRWTAPGGRACRRRSPSGQDGAPRRAPGPPHPDPGRTRIRCDGGGRDDAAHGTRHECPRTSVLAELGPVRPGQQRRVQGALGRLEGGVGAPVVLIAQQLHLEALGGAVDGAQGTRGPEGDPTLLDGRALAHDLLLRVAIDCLSFDRTPGRRVPSRVRAKPRARPRSRRLDVLRDALP